MKSVPFVITKQAREAYASEGYTSEPSRYWLEEMAYVSREIWEKARMAFPRVNCWDGSEYRVSRWVLFHLAELQGKRVEFYHEKTFNDIPNAGWRRWLHGKLV